MTQPELRIVGSIAHYQPSSSILCFLLLFMEILQSGSDGLPCFVLSLVLLLISWFGHPYFELSGTGLPSFIASGVYLSSQTKKLLEGGSSHFPFLLVVFTPLNGPVPPSPFLSPLHPSTQ